MKYNVVSAGATLAGYAFCFSITGIIGIIKGQWSNNRIGSYDTRELMMEERFFVGVGKHNKIVCPVAVVLANLIIR